MSERLKKILLVAAFIGSVIGIGAVLYFVFFQPAPPPATVGNLPGAAPGTLPQSGLGGPVAPTTPTTPGTLPTASPVANGGLTQTTVLTATAVTNITSSANGDGVNYYDGTTNRFYAINDEGEVIELSETEFPDVDSVAWNGDGDTAVIEFPDGSNIVYNFEDETQVTLPAHWQDFAFSPTQDEIYAVSMGVSPENRFLLVTNEDGSQVQAIEAVGENEDKVQVNPSPSDQVVAFADTAGALSSFDRKMIIPVGPNSENLKGLVVEGLGFEGRWSPTGTHLLYSAAGAYSNYRPLLWVVDGSSNTIGDNRLSLGINTWVDKCTFADNTTVYCAVPQQMVDNAGMQRGILDNTPDSLYVVDIISGRSSLVAQPENGAEMTNLRVSSDGTTLFFVNGITGQLESLKLK